MSPLLGYKLGMTRVFNEQGRTIPVTAVRIDDCYVSACRTTEKDGYTAVQIATGLERHPNKPYAGQHSKLPAVPKYVREFRVADVSEFEVGQKVGLDSLTIGDKLKLGGVSKGKGFAGVIKRHNFKRGPETHGSDHHRRPGSNGSMYPQHVLKGKKQPGHLGVEQITLRNVVVVDILPEQNILLVSGPVPGSRGALVELSHM